MFETVFYSWQSDLSPTRYFIQKALNEAITQLNNEGSLPSRLKLDLALRNTAGAPRVDDDILERIRNSAAVVADVTLVTAANDEGRRSPNPNVLFELGYAVALHEWNKVILPYNEAFGGKEDLPFDLDKHRLLKFRLPEDVNEQQNNKVDKDIIKDFKNAISLIMGLPSLKEKITKLLDQTNPEILNRVRNGEHQIGVMLASEHITTLKILLGQNNANQLVTFRQNHSVSMGGNNRSGNCINDLQEYGVLTGYIPTFKGAW